MKYAELKSSIKNNKAIIFIGSGLSKRCGLPLWADIVKDVLNQPEIENGSAFSIALDSGILSPLEILDKLQENHKKTIYKVFSKNTRIEAKDLIYSKIKKISKKIITTNYDTLIEQNTDIEPIDPHSDFALSSLDTLNEYILKIHGNYSNIDHCVIFTSDYEKLYKEDGNLSKFQFEKLISTHTCLFIGFSLNDHYVVKLFQHLQKLYNSLGPKHYIISTEKINFNFVETIKINEHSELETVLDEILDSIEEKPKPNANNISIDIQQQKSTNEKYYPSNDTAPIVEDWTGRQDELEALSMNHKACFITGIGGQGKSSLASKFLSLSQHSSYVFRDWRDFKEENLNFQFKLYCLIELVSHNKIKIDNLVGIDTTELIDIFFRELGYQKGIFIFDNIDKYIDLEKFLPAGDMMLFFEKVMRHPHNSKFIFTCRPFIQYASIGSYHLKLEGLAIEDAKFLLQKYHAKISTEDLENYSRRLHNATRGHPLWMALSIAQSRNELTQLHKLIINIETRNISETDINYSASISRTVLDNLWANLKENEKIILRALSVSAISESEEDLSNVLRSKINYNKFTKSMRSLKLLNLVISKENSGHIELHPLVREFIVNNYGRDEQDSYIALYVKYLNGFIVLLQEKFGKSMNPEDIERIIKKVEITNNSNDFQESINELRRSWESIMVSGYAEEALRVSDNLLSKITWNIRKLGEINGFFNFIDNFFTKTSEYGDNDLFNKHMNRYLSTFQTPDKNLILAKANICRNAWHSGNYDLAVKEGKSASDLIDHLNENDTWNGKWIYHLALRDSKNESNLEKALNFFLEGSDIDEILDDVDTSATPSRLGNIGRCLIYKKDMERGFLFLCKSYKIFKKTNATYYSKHNLGYASLWISEYLQEINKTKQSLYFLINSKNTWKEDMPVESNRIENKISKISMNAENSSIISLESWQISKYCDEFVDKHFEQAQVDKSIKRPFDETISTAIGNG